MNPKQKHDQLRIITYNVHSIQRPERLLELEHAFNNGAVKFDILGLAETWRHGRETARISTGYVLHNSGPTPPARSTGSGVAFYISAQVDKRVEGIRFISDRIIQLVLNVGGCRKIRLTQVYAPHSAHDDDDYDAFLDDLTSALSGRRFSHDYVIGDFNAVVGPARRGDRCCGRFGTGARNERGETLVNYCESAGLSIANSWFKKRPQRKWTWLSPDAKTANEIDYVLARDRAPITDVSVLSRCNFNSDHRLVRANIHLQNRRRFAPPRPRQLPATFDRFQLQIAMAARAQDLPEDAPLADIISAMNDVQHDTARRPTPRPNPAHLRSYTTPPGRATPPEAGSQSRPARTTTVHRRLQGRALVSFR